MPLVNQMIDEHGNIDSYIVRLCAQLRSAKIWGDHNYPPMLYRNSMRFCQDRANDMRLAWRRDHGLPDDSAVTMVDVPDWGASGDSFDAR